MFTSKALSCALVFAGMIGAAATPLPSFAAASFDIQLNFAPPPRSERVPAARAGYTWSPGHWEWRGGRHDWVPGNWVQGRAGYIYYAPRWVERNGRWQFESRRWNRDGDGVPDRRDAKPDNPNRR